MAACACNTALGRKRQEFQKFKVILLRELEVPVGYMKFFFLSKKEREGERKKKNTKTLSAGVR